MAKDWALPFYRSTAWKTTRDAYFKARCGICERCGAAGDIVHHRKHLTPATINDPKITLAFENLELLCQDCHNKEHTSASSGRYRIGPDGAVLPPGTR